MISAAGQLGAGALSRTGTGDIPDVARAEVRVFGERSYARVSRFRDIGGSWVFSSGQFGAGPSIDFGANTAGAMPRGTALRSARFKAVSEATSWAREEVGPINIDIRGSIESRHRDWFYSGSFVRKSDISPAPHELDVLNQMRARGTEVTTAAAGSSSTPYVSVIWSLVEAQQLRKARALLKLVPDSAEYTKLKRLLSTPVARVSQRKDFDRSPEYRWLAENAKNYVGKWVAISGDSLIAAAKTLKDLREEVKKATPARAPLLHYVE